MKKKLSIIPVIIIIIGIIIVASKGFNVDLSYKAHESINAPIGVDYNIDDIKKITSEVFGKEKVKIEKSGIYEDGLNISVNEISDEQLKNLKNKLNEKYEISQNLRISMGEAEYTTEDIQAIANEVFAKDNLNVEKYKEDEKYVVIEAPLVSQEDIENLNTKINEKYALSNEASSIGATNKITKIKVPKVRLRDIAKQYTLYVPVAKKVALYIPVASIIILVYFALRFRKLGVKNVLIQVIKSLVLAELIYMSIIAITRYPINTLAMMTAIIIGGVVLTYTHQMFCKEITKNEKNK